MTSLKTTFSKSILLMLGLGMIATLAACGGGGHVTTTPPPAISVTLTGAPTTLTVNATAMITATVANDSSGKGVTWSCAPAGSCGTFSSATTLSGAAVTYTAPATVPSSTVIITATSVADPTKSASSAAITITAVSAAASITATSGSGQSTTVSTAFAAPLIATVLDSNSLPVSGASVTFTAPSTGASGTFASTGTNTETVITDATGLATSSTITANATAGGPYTVTATVAGVATAANFTLTNTTAAAEIITATAGSGQSTVVSTAFTIKLAATVTQGGAPVAGVVVTFTAPASGASGTFANGTATTNATTNASGVATASKFTANATAGTYTVTASAPGATSATFTLTNTAVTTLGAGTYVFSASGTDSANGPYSVAGAFTIDSTGTITAGEQDFDDFVTEQPDAITSGSVVAASDGNLTITLVTADTGVGVAGTETFRAALVTSSKALIAEFDTFATSSGELDLQPAAPPAPAGPYAFFANGADSGLTQMSYGGVINIDGAGSISGAGSILDLNRNGALFANATLNASTVTGPDAFGRVIFALVPSVASTLPSIKLIGYMADATHIRLVEGLDGLGGITGGVALGQSGALTVSGDSYVIAATGQDPNGAIQVAGVLTFNSDLSISGNVSFNDLTAQSPQGGSAITGGTYTIDTTLGKVTVTGLTDLAADFTYNLNLYLTGDGHATVVFMDTAPTPNVLGGLAFKQAASLSASSFSGSYGVNFQQVVAAAEQDGVGTVSADGLGAFTGFLDVNENFVTAPNLALSGTFAAGSTNGVLTGTITGPVLSTAQTFTYYVADPTLIVAIENDNVQLTLGYFESQ